MIQENTNKINKKVEEREKNYLNLQNKLIQKDDIQIH